MYRNGFFSSRLNLPFVLLLLPLLTTTIVDARSSGGGQACHDATASLCSLACPNDNIRPWATYQSNDVLSPCCPAGMDMVAPPTRNKGYRVHLKGVGQVVRPQKMKDMIPY